MGFETTKSSVQYRGPCTEVNTIDFNPFNEYLLLTGSNDKTCVLWDLRNLKKKLHNFKHHINDVINFKWNPFIMSMFVSSSCDRRVDIWDLSNIGNNNINGNNNTPNGKDKEKNKENNEEELKLIKGPLIIINIYVVIALKI